MVSYLIDCFAILLGIVLLVTSWALLLIVVPYKLITKEILSKKE
jgi:hypothetical protein